MWGLGRERYFLVKSAYHKGGLSIVRSVVKAKMAIGRYCYRFVGGLVRMNKGSVTSRQSASVATLLASGCGDPRFVSTSFLQVRFLSASADIAF